MELKVEDIMTENVATVKAKGTVREAAELMDKLDTGCLIVLKGDKPVGIVTERDMLKRVVLEVVDPVYTKVHKIMSKPLVAGRLGMTIEDASNLMREKKIKRLPIVKSGHVVGLITAADFVRSPQVIKMMIQKIRKQIYSDVLTTLEAKLEIE